MSEWKTKKWGDLAVLKYGKALRGYRNVEGPFRVFGTNGPIGWHTEAQCAHPSVVVGRKGAYRGVHYSENPFWVIDTAYYLSPRVEFDMKWAYYELLTHDINSMDSGSAIPSTARDAFYNLGVRVPPLGEQRRIAHILGTLDDKIELNRRMNRTLEAIARAVFKSWFIDFDPVIDNAILDGRPIPDEFAKRAEVRREILARSQPSPPSPLPEVEGRQLAPDAGPSEVSSSPPRRGGGEGVADYRHLFPDGFQDSPLGMIPKGWEVSTVGKEFNLTMGQSPPGSTYNEEGDGLPFFQGRRDFGFRFPRKRVSCTAPKRICEAGDTLVSVRAPVGDVNMAPEQLCVGRGLAAVRHVSGCRSYTYYAMLSLQNGFREYESEGTVFGAINKGQFSGLEWIALEAKLVKAFENCLSATDEVIWLNEAQSLRLASIRESLLPSLLSGELLAVPLEDL